MKKFKIVNEILMLNIKIGHLNTKKVFKIYTIHPNFNLVIILIIILLFVYSQLMSEKPRRSQINLKI